MWAGEQIWSETWDFCSFRLRRPGLFSPEKSLWRVSIRPNITCGRRRSNGHSLLPVTQEIKGSKWEQQLATQSKEMPHLWLTLNAPWQISLDMHKQVQNSNIDKLTKTGCIKCSDNVVATFGHSSPGKWNKGKQTLSLSLPGCCQIQDVICR